MYGFHGPHTLFFLPHPGPFSSRPHPRPPGGRPFLTPGELIERRKTKKASERAHDLTTRLSRRLPMHPHDNTERLLAPLRRHLSKPQWQNLLALVVALQLARTLIQRQLALYLLWAISC